MSPTSGNLQVIGQRNLRIFESCLKCEETRDYEMVRKLAQASSEVGLVESQLHYLSETQCQILNP